MAFAIPLRWMARSAATAALALSLAACDSADDRIAKHFARGTAFAEAGDTTKAALEFRNVLRLSADHAPSRLGLARIQEQEGEFRAALGSYRAVAELDPQNVEARVKLAQFSLLGGALDDAARYADAAYALDPTSPDVLATRASVLLRVGDEAGAVAAAQDALGGDPAHVGARVILATLRAAAGDLAAALVVVDDGLAQVPDDVALNVLKLRLLVQIEDDDAVGAQLHAMVSQFPDQDEFKVALAQWQLRGGDEAAAEATLRQRAASRPDEFGPALDVVRLVAQLRGEAAAQAELEAGEAAGGPLAADYAFALAELDYAAGNAEAAERRLSALAQASGPRQSEAAARLGSLKLAAGDAAAAGEIAQTILAQDRGNVDALVLRARVRLAELRAGDAIVDLRAAINADPDNVTILLLAAQAYSLDGSPELAGDMLSSAVRASNYDARPTLLYARHLRDRRQLGAGEAVLSEAARRRPRDRAILAALSDVRFALEDWAGVEEVAQQLAALDSADPALDRLQAALLIEQGRLDEGIELLSDMVGGAAADQQGALAALISSYVRAGRSEEAAAFLDRLLAENPANLRARLLRAELHLLAGETDLAEGALREIIRVAPADPLGYTALVRFKMSLGAYDEAETIARDSLTVVDSAFAIRLHLAELLERRGAFSEAITEYQALFDAQPASIVVANNLASLIAEHEADDPEKVAFAARVAQRLRASEVPNFQDTYGWIMFLSGNYQQALRSLEPAAAALPDNPLVRYHAGRAYAALRLRDEAIGHLEAALAIDPDFPKAASARETLATLRE